MTATQLVRNLIQDANRLGVGSQVWDLLTALRGPDEGWDDGSSDEVKDQFTCPIRYALGVTYPGRLADPECDADAWRKITDTEVSGLENTHYRSHIYMALTQLHNDARLEEPDNDA